MPAEMQPTWLCHWLVANRLATLTEVETTMSVDDVDMTVIAAELIYNMPEG